MAKKKPVDKIGIVNSAALAEGLSYGKYMAKHNWDPPCLHPFRDVYDTPEVKRCTICGNAIPKPRLRANAKTCCASCGDKLHAQSVQKAQRLKAKKDGTPTD